MTIRVNQPDEFFPWLADWVGKGGPFVCCDVVYDATGGLTFALRNGEHELSVVWCVPRPRDGEAPFGDGSMRVEGGESLRRGADVLALRQVRARIEALRARARVPLLERRNRDFRVITFGDGVVTSLCSDMLSPQQTRCGLFRFDKVAVVDGVVHLSFRGMAGTHMLALCPHDAPAPGEVIGRYGPLLLVGPATRSADAERLARYVGYVLSLCVHGDMKLLVPDEEPGAGVPVTETPVQNPFLYEHASCGSQLAAAMYASRGKVVSVFHADRECTGFAAYLTGVTETAYLPLAGVRPTLDYLRTMRIVDTNELDAIMTGCQTQLTGLVRETVEERPELLLVMGTCVSRVIGDSVENAVLDAGAAEQGVPTVWVETTATDQDQHHRKLWKRLLEMFQRPRLGEGRAVNLFGYGHWRTPSIPELTGLLESIGVRRNATVIPTFDMEEIKRIGEADLNLLLPSATARNAMRWARDVLQAPLIEPPGPFGIERTRAWVNAVSQFYGMGTVGDDWQERAFGPMRHAWEGLVEQAREHRVCIVLTLDHFDRAMPMSRGGAPWIVLLEEMGFALDIFLIPAQATAPDSPQARARAMGQTRSVLAEPDRHAVQCVASMQELQDAVTRSTSELIYTEVVADRRAVSAGKTPINYLDFEMGFQGACRSLEKLVQLARTPFYRRYGRHLACSGW
jgi:hypothetical protein